MSEKLPPNGWNMAAQMLADNGLSLPDARDLVIGFSCARVICGPFQIGFFADMRRASVSWNALP